MADARPPAPLRWGADPPAVPGWHFWRDGPDIGVVHVYAAVRGEMCATDGKRRWPVSECRGCEWAGPVPEPGE